MVETIRFVGIYVGESNQKGFLNGAGFGHAPRNESMVEAQASQKGEPPWDYHPQIVVDTVDGQNPAPL